jgi:hypothetical protein
VAEEVSFEYSCKRKLLSWGQHYLTGKFNLLKF